MENYRINTNYAKALFLVAADEGQLDAVNDDMRLVADTCADNHILSTVFANPVIPEHRKTAVLRDLFADRVSRVSKPPERSATTCVVSPTTERARVDHLSYHASRQERPVSLLMSTVFSS